MKTTPKRLLAALTAASLCFAPLSSKFLSSKALSENPFDVNGDGIAAVEDALNVLRIVVGLTDENEQNADIDNDGKVSSNDALLILKNVVGLPTDIPEKKESKILVAYFSFPEEGTDADAGASRVVNADGQVEGNVEYFANIIAKETGADLFRIETVQKYPTTHQPLVSQASEERQNNARPELASHIENLDDYDTIFIGYPIWWYDMPMAMNTFFEEYDFSGKTIVPFSSHGGSGFSTSINDIKEYEPDAEILDGFTVSRERVPSSAGSLIDWVRGLDIEYPRNESPDNNKNKTLVAYFSVSQNGENDAISSATITSYKGKEMGGAEVLANIIAEKTGGELFAVKTEKDYPLEYGELADFAKDEQDNGELPTLSEHIENFDEYDRVFVVYPAWWYTMPQAVYSFFDEYDFSGKTIIPAATHAGSGLAGAPKTIAELEPEAIVINNGFAVSASKVAGSENDVEEWLKEIEYN